MGDSLKTRRAGYVVWRMLLLAGILLVSSSFFALRCSADFANAQEPVALQDQNDSPSAVGDSDGGPASLSPDIVGYFSPAAPRVALRLYPSGATGLERLREIEVSILNPQGVESTVLSDERGIVWINDAVPGIYAVVVFGTMGHAAGPIVLRANDSGEDRYTPPLRIPVAEIPPVEVTRVMSAYLAPAFRGFADEVDALLISSGTLGAQESFRVRLTG